MSIYYPVDADSIKYYYYSETAWVDITQYVLNSGRISGEWGLPDTDYLSRVAKDGRLNILLNNDSDKFDPDDVDCFTGWQRNTKVKMVITFEERAWTKFYGYVHEITLDDNTYNFHTAHVVVVDWMYWAYNSPLEQQSIITDKTGDYAVNEIVTATGHAPLATEYAVGEKIYDAIFDSMTTTTTAATELNKIMLSGNGYFYCRHSGDGETLVFETEATRNALREINEIPKPTIDCEYLLDETGDYLLLEDGDKINLDEAQDADINESAEGFYRTHGDNVVNKITVIAYPKRTDTTEQKIYSLGTPILLKSGETKTIKVWYRNATTSESLNAITSLCVQPVATTDYLMNRRKDGTGTDITANLTVSVVYRTALAEITLTNTGGSTGRVIKLNLRGYGVYQDSPLEATIDDTDSQENYGISELNINQQYSRDTAESEIYANKILRREKDPHTVLKSVTMVANKSNLRMLAFCAVDIGDMVKITESSLGMADYYYVNGISFSIADGNIITFKWLLEKTESLYTGALTLVGAEFPVPPAGEESSILNFGRVLELVDLPQFSITAWCNPPSADWIDVHHGDIVCAWVDNEGGIEWRLSHNSIYGVWSFITIVHSGGGGRWQSNVHPNIVFDQWSNVGVSTDMLTKTVKFYANGTLFNTYIIEEPVGYMESYAGADYNIGNIRSTNPPSDLAYPFYGTLADIRHHDCILTDAEFAKVSADGIGGAGVQRGLKFQAPCVRTRDLSYWTDHSMTTDDRVIDNYSGYVGKRGSDGAIIIRGLP